MKRESLSTDSDVCIARLIICVFAVDERLPDDKNIILASHFVQNTKDDAHNDGAPPVWKHGRDQSPRNSISSEIPRMKDTKRMSPQFGDKSTYESTLFSAFAHSAAIRLFVGAVRREGKISPLLLPLVLQTRLSKKDAIEYAAADRETSVQNLTQFIKGKSH